MFELVLEADKQAFIFLNSCYAGWLDAPMLFFTAEFTWMPLYAFLLWRVFRSVDIKRFGIFIIAMVCVIVLADQTTSSYMKPTFQRLRPSHEARFQAKIHLVRKDKGEVYRGGRFGFASSHAANSFGLAMFFFLCFRKRWRGVSWLFVWAGAVSYTRIYLGVHYPLDIIAGGLIGMLGAWLIFRICVLSKIWHSLPNTQPTVQE